MFPFPHLVADPNLQIIGVGLSSQPISDWNQTLLRGGKAESNYQQETGMGSSTQDHWTQKLYTGSSEDSSSNDYKQINPGLSLYHSQFSPQISTNNFQMDPNIVYGGGFSTTFQGLLGLENLQQGSSSSYGYPPSYGETLGPWPKFPQFLGNSPRKQTTNSQLQFSSSTLFWNPKVGPVNGVHPNFFPSSQLQFSPSNFEKPKNISDVKDFSTVGKKNSSESSSKRARNEAPTPLPAFKVRKEKMGDRITALQQLVSPFGKADTESVLFEAIEYIKFLHEQIQVLQFFPNRSKVSGRGPGLILVPIMRKNIPTFKLASGEEIGDNLSVQVIDAGSPDKFEILEIGKLDSVENNTFEMDLIHNYVNVVNTIEEGVAVASLDKQHNSFEISADNRGGELAVDGLAIDNGENMGSNIDEQPVAIASLENQHNNATISSIGVINSGISLQQLDEVTAVHTEENVAGASEECIITSSKLLPRNGIDISLEELEKVSGMKREDAAKMLKVSVSTLKRACRDYQISRWPPRKKTLDQSRSCNSAQTGSTKELGGSVPTVQNESLVTIKAKYGDNFIKFKLSASSGIIAFNQQVSKRLELEAGSYVVKYQDDDNDWILVRCDDDLQDYISSSASLGKTTLTMLLEHI